ncbi:MAG: nicotinate phosphoribosyltransferase [Erysipelotrichaceae bacterium]|nr:nicotinate phosphoribosyltransferase [Erysipelotrichaceae bacterium]MDY5251269.1 nicotinate phosphoribosyltransferase [Erysipelotrichaceae bacterium]
MRNLTMLMDFYELTMANGYYNLGLKDEWVVFDLFYRKNPDNGGFVIAAGLEQAIDYLLNLSFNEDDIAYLRSKHLFSEDFLAYLKDLKFTGNVYGVKEGTIVYPNTPLLTIEAPLCEAQLVETMLLLTINHQSLIATKANRIVRAAKGRTVMEFGARRAQGYDGAIYGTRACYIGGVGSTATVIADQMFDVPAVGTMAHSWVQYFESEYDAFKAYAEIYPTNCVLLIDTYDAINSGVPNAIKVAKEVLEPQGHKLLGVRLDSGDLAYLSKKIRMMLDDAGLEDTKIVVSNSIDEYLLESLFDQGAMIDSFGVGERMITSSSEPVFGGVYKIVAKKQDDKYQPKIKISENVDKITNPGFKWTYRVYDQNGMGMFDFLALADEKIDIQSLELVDENKPYKKITIDPSWYVEKIQYQFIKDGELIYELPTLKQIQDDVKLNLAKVWDEEKRFSFPHKHYVDLTRKLYDVKCEMLKNYEGKN